MSEGRTYVYRDGAEQCSHGYITPVVLELAKRNGARRVLDVGCGNGALCASLAALGLEVVGCDVSESGIEIARANVPNVEFHRLGVYDAPAGLAARPFDLVVATEVIEHLFRPAALLEFATAVLQPRGLLLLSTPYHGYLKNLAIALLGKWDTHHSPQWDGGHIKFWSRATLQALLEENGFELTAFRGAGRAPLFWKSMIVLAQKRG